MSLVFIYLLVVVAMFSRISSFRRFGRPSQLTKLVRMSGGASEGEMAPFTLLA